MVSISIHQVRIGPKIITATYFNLTGMTPPPCPPHGGPFRLIQRRYPPCHRLPPEPGDSQSRGGAESGAGCLFCDSHLVEMAPLTQCVCASLWTEPAGRDSIMETQDLLDELFGVAPIVASRCKPASVRCRRHVLPGLSAPCPPRSGGS